MSQEEQDAQIGRTVREEAQLQKDLATIDRELDSIENGFGSLSMQIRQILLHSKNDIVMPPQLQQYSNWEGVISLVNDRIETNRKIKKANDYLIKMGVKRSVDFDGAPRFE